MEVINDIVISRRERLRMGSSYGIPNDQMCREYYLSSCTCQNTKNERKIPRDSLTAAEDQFTVNFSNKVCKKHRHASKELHSKTFKKRLHNGRENIKKVVNSSTLSDFFAFCVELDADRSTAYNRVGADEFPESW